MPRASEYAAADERSGTRLSGQAAAVQASGRERRVAEVGPARAPQLVSAIEHLELWPSCDDSATTDLAGRAARGRLRPGEGIGLQLW